MLKQYNCLEEKGSYFNCDTISSFADLQRKLQDNANEKFVFRGHRSALWKIFSSSQREWDANPCRACWEKRFHERGFYCEDSSRQMKSAYLLFIHDMLKYMRNRICEVVTCPSIQLISDIQLIGFLQHYGGVSPFVDFSDNWHVAVFMAIKDLKPKDYAKNEYFSIYAIDTRDMSGNECVYIEDVPDEQGEVRGEDNPFRVWGDVDALMIKKLDSRWCPMVSEGRMASQGGLFAYHKHEEQSLEEVFSQKDRGVSRATRWLNKITCYDVPYSLAKNARAFLRRNNITSSSLGLEDKTIEDKVKSIFKDFQREYRVGGACLV